MNAIVNAYAYNLSLNAVRAARMCEHWHHLAAYAASNGGLYIEPRGQTKNEAAYLIANATGVDIKESNNLLEMTAKYQDWYIGLAASSGCLTYQKKTFRWSIEAVTKAAIKRISCGM